MVMALEILWPCYENEWWQIPEDSAAWRTAQHKGEEEGPENSG